MRVFNYVKSPPNSFLHPSIVPQFLRCLFGSLFLAFKHAGRACRPKSSTACNERHTVQNLVMTCCSSACLHSIFPPLYLLTHSTFLKALISYSLFHLRNHLCTSTYFCLWIHFNRFHFFASPFSPVSIISLSPWLKSDRLHKLFYRHMAPQRKYQSRCPVSFISFLFPSLSLYPSPPLSIFPLPVIVISLVPFIISFRFLYFTLPLFLTALLFHSL